MAQTNFGALGVADGYAVVQPVQAFHLDTLAFFTSGNLAVGNRVGAAIVGVAGAVADVRASVDTAPAGASIILDVKKNGVTLFTTAGNRPTIAAGQNASTTVLPDVTALAAGDKLSIDVIQVGSTTAGANLTLSVSVRRAHIA